MNILILTDFVGCGDVAMATDRAVLTRMGHRALCLPTALISNTWNLGAPAQLDTTAYLRDALAAWEQNGIAPEAVVIGYIADEAQAQWLAVQCVRWHGMGIPVFLDPIFADNGKLYRGITPERLDFLRQMMRHADYILPNATEADFLSKDTGLDGLIAMGARGVVITGAENTVILWDGAEKHTIPYTPVPGQYSGAGDAFAAYFIGSILNGQSPNESARTAIAQTKEWILRKNAEGSEGVGLPVERYF